MATVDRLWLGVWRLLLLGYQVDQKALQDTSDELLQLINSANGNCCDSGCGWVKVSSLMQYRGLWNVCNKNFEHQAKNVIHQL